MSYSWWPQSVNSLFSSGLYQYVVCPDRISFAYLVLVRDINTQTSIQYVEYYSLLTSPKG